MTVASGRVRAFDNIAFEAGGCGKEFFPFLALHAECIEGCYGMLDKDLSITFAHAEVFMGSLHIASRVFLFLLSLTA